MAINAIGYWCLWGIGHRDWYDVALVVRIACLFRVDACWKAWQNLSLTIGAFFLVFGDSTSVSLCEGRECWRGSRTEESWRAAERLRLRMNAETEIASRHSWELSRDPILGSVLSSEEGMCRRARGFIREGEKAQSKLVITEFYITKIWLQRRPREDSAETPPKTTEIWL